MFGGDDDDDFVPVNNSKLASLFSSKSVSEGNSSLTYTAPKQPKKPNEIKTAPTHPSKEPSRSSKDSNDNKLSIIIVKAVNTYKLQDGKYALQGKLGAAVLGNSTICVYQLLLYKGKQQHITSTKIHSNFQFTVQPSNYATFYDDNKQNWSIHFEKCEDAEEFAKEIGLARANAQAGKGIVKSLLTQEMLVGEGPTANVGDSIEIFYNVRSFLDTKMGQPIESNLRSEKPQRVKIRKNVWEEGLIGATRGSKRIIMLPPNLVGPWKQEVSPNTSIVVEVEVNRIKQSRGEVEEAPRSTATSRADSGDSAVDSSTDDTSIRARGASISEALTASPKTNKANIISRMAKMGQATLPLKGAVVCNPSDSEETEDEVLHPSNAKLPTISKPSAKNRSGKLRSKAPSPPSPPDSTPPNGPPKPTNVPLHQVTVYQPLPMAWQQQQQQQQFPMGQFGMGQLDGQMYPMVSQTTGSSHQLFPASPNTIVGTPTGMAPSDSIMSIFMSESRTQNMEVRMGVAKVVDKVDQVLAKLDTAQNLKPTSTNAIMDPGSLLASIQKLVTENEQLKMDIAEKGSKIELQNDRIYQLLNTNHKYLEQSNFSSNDHRNQEALMNSLQRERDKLTDELGDSRVTNESLIAQVESLKEENTKITSNMGSRLKTLEEELSNCKSVILEQDLNLQNLDEKLRGSVEAKEAHEKKMASLRSFLLELEGSKEKVEICLRDATQQLEVQRLEAEDHQKKLNAKYSAHIAALMEKGATLKAQVDVAKKASSDLSIVKPVDELKKVMNVVYKTLHREFSPEKTYQGEFIREALQTTIRDVTCQFLESTTTTELNLTQPKQQVETVFGERGYKVSKEPYVVSTHLYSNPESNIKPQDSLTTDVSAAPSGIQSQSGGVKPREDEFKSSTRIEGNPKEPKYVGTNSSEHSLQVIDLSLPTLAEERLIDSPEPSLPELPKKMGFSSELPVENRTSGEPADITSVLGDKETKNCVPTTVRLDTASGGENMLAGDKLVTNQLEENINKKLRESSLERKPWHSEPPPPPLHDEDEDEDDWLS